MIYRYVFHWYMFSSRRSLSLWGPYGAATSIVYQYLCILYTHRHDKDVHRLFQGVLPTPCARVTTRITSHIVYVLTHAWRCWRGLAWLSFERAKLLMFGTCNVCVEYVDNRSTRHARACHNPPVLLPLLVRSSSWTHSGW